MRSGFWLTGYALLWAWILGLRIFRRVFARRWEHRVAGWPSMPGTVSAGSVRPCGGSWRVVLTYDWSERGYGTDLWRHDFRSKAQAEHARQAMVGHECVVHITLTGSTRRRCFGAKWSRCWIVNLLFPSWSR